MKKITFLFILATLISACQKEEMKEIFPGEEGKNVLIQFTTSPLQIETKSFADNSKVAEKWESEIHGVYLYALSGNTCIDSYSLSKAEVETGEKMIVIPLEYLGKEIRFIAYVNYWDSLFPVSALSTFQYYVSDMLENYNGTMEKIEIGNVREMGLEMIGDTKMKISEDGSISTVPIELERIVNKVAISTHVSKKFTEFYNGASLKVNRIYTDRTSNKSHMLRGSSILMASQMLSLSQIPIYENEFYKNIFYTFEVAAPLTFYIECTFDEDGDWNTTNDQKKITYHFKTNAGYINNSNRRNEFYQISVTINGLPETVLPLFIVDETWGGSIEENNQLGSNN